LLLTWRKRCRRRPRPRSRACICSAVPCFVDRTDRIQRSVRHSRRPVWLRRTNSGVGNADSSVIPCDNGSQLRCPLGRNVEFSSASPGAAVDCVDSSLGNRRYGGRWTLDFSLFKSVDCPIAVVFAMRHAFLTSQQPRVTQLHVAKSKASGNNCALIQLATAIHHINRIRPNILHPKSTWVGFVDPESILVSWGWLQVALIKLKSADLDPPPVTKVPIPTPCRVPLVGVTNNSLISDLSHIHIQNQRRESRVP
jgi:hypothetical protein